MDCWSDKLLQGYVVSLIAHYGPFDQYDWDFCQRKPQMFIWTDKMQKAFEQTKALMITDSLSAYPDHNTPFEIYTDTSD